ncbi:hypothetical protein B0H15DRAFT_945777 [Mycena belliarum]|uniref:CxC2-like cysteine cluster KDZ transposase-associated domain-containing protein n=1 Tax=Mycena belliarum TaxID=1033014 RepID=A0AAD6UBA1_9AGAR|nr:hypothetical protein B0H15DRAFT_945777 [Mycena belliae]
MLVWRPMKALFLDELLRHDGLGDDLHAPQCALCSATYDVSSHAPPQLFKCGDCGQFLQCKACCLSRHALAPLHVVKQWNGDFWTTTTLASLGLVYQLGHGGQPCPVPDDRVLAMTVIEAPIIHQIRIRYCNCGKHDGDNLEQLMRNAWYPASVTDPSTCATFKTLEAFRLYNVTGNMNVHDFIRALERATDTTSWTGMTWLPDRYKQFQRMARQWAFLMRVKRAGRGQDPRGVEKTRQREAAVICWACPYDGRNLPEGWRDVDPKYRFLYMLLIAVDANFRLKNRMRANETEDPSLGPGWGYWVEPMRYKRHLRKYVGEKDLSTCIAFAALLQKDTRLTTGLRCSGVGGCVCARHECVRPNGMGDLQKGERYANMDFIVLSALFGFSLMLLTISYNIACQWKKGLPERNAKMPSAIRLPLDTFTYQCALPVWHAASHNEDCQNENSLSFKSGVGKSDGEGVERVWSVLNPAANHTKDANSGQRVDVLEDKIDSHNFLKNIGQGDALQRKLLIALAERERQVAAFKEVNSTIHDNLKKEWKKMIEKWLADPSSAPNPYSLSRKECPTEAEVRLEVKRDEDLAIGGARSPLTGRSATAFLVAGMQIEEAQRRIIGEVGGTALVTADQEGKLHDWRRALLVKIAKFRELQAMYMPGAAEVIATEEAKRDADAVPPRAERIKLFMPSQMPTSVGGSEGLRGCVPGLLGMETKLRGAQCLNALVKLRARLHAKRHLISFRNENVTGQIQTTKARTLIGQVGERVEACARKYRHAREALIALNGEQATEAFKELRPEDIRLDGDAGESDAAVRKKLAMAGAGRGARAPRNAPGTSKKVMSWIWTSPGALDDGEQQLHESVRVEWARARARKVRWEEEVMTLREEMRRVLRYLAWQSAWWRSHAGLRADLSPEIGAGVRAYALKQAHWHDKLAAFFEKKWQMPALAAAQHLVAEQQAADLEGAELDQFFSQHRHS